MTQGTDLGIPLYLIMIFGYKGYHMWKGDHYNSHGVKPIEADFYSGKAEIDAEEEEYLAAKAAAGKNDKGGKFYKRYIGWMI